jgi:glycosyltransferase involved in cell wall biosynthesis
MVFSARARFDPRTPVIYVSEMLDWVIDEVGRQIQSHLPADYRMHISGTYKGYRNCLVHLGAPVLYLDLPHVQAIRAANNRVLLTWTHGLPGSLDPQIPRRIDSLINCAPYLDRLKVMTTTARDFVLSCGIPGDKIALIPLGVDVKHFTPPSSAQRDQVRRELEIPDTAICVGSFQKDSPGRDNSSREPKWVKGPDVLVDALIRLAEHYPIYVLLTSPARGYVIERLREAGIPFRHDVLARAADLNRYYQALDLYLITSRDEGGPMSLLEAMASGIPVVSTRMGIPSDIIRHGENGMLADVDDLEELVTSACRVLDSPSLADKIRVEALGTVQAHAWPVIANRYARELYDPVAHSDTIKSLP